MKGIADAVSASAWPTRRWTSPETDDFFLRLELGPVERRAVLGPVRRSAEFASACAESAWVMAVGL